MYERNVSRKPSQVVMVLRWIALLPASVGAAWAAWLVVEPPPFSWTPDCLVC